MSFYRDAVQTARDARRVGEQRAAQLAAELAAIRGWLTVGDPSRLTDGGDRVAAQRAADLMAELTETHRGLLALNAELDALDGTPPESALAFREWSRWLAGVPDAATLLAELVPDPRRLFLGGQPRMTTETAQRIVDTVAANGGQVGDGEAFLRAAGLTDDDEFDLGYTGRTRLDPLVAGHAVGVLLPLRLVTRFHRPLDGGPWLLRVRVHPDPVAVASPPAPATATEADLVATCWTRAGGDLTTDAGEAAFRSLAAAVGGGRAAHLLRTVPVVRDGAGFAAWGNYRAQGIEALDHRAALPEVLQLWGDSGEGLRLLGELRPDLAAITAQADLDTAMTDLRPDRVPELWWTSYRVAKKVGLAIDVDLPAEPEPHFDVLLVTGLGDADPSEVFAAHARHGDLAVVAPMSSTNTIAGAPAADLGRDPATWLAVARSAGTGTAAGLAGWLTGRPLLDGVPEADTGLLAAVPPLVTALWPVLWQRWLKDVEGAPTEGPPAEVYRMGDWASRVLNPLGPFPALRVGDLPYGVLPAADLTAWVTPGGDPTWEGAIVHVLDTVLGAWADAATTGGTAAGADPDRLLEIIGRVPTSRAHGSRAFLPVEIVALLRATVLGQDPEQVLAEWRADAAAVLGFAPEPVRRYQSYGYVQPPPDHDGDVRDRLHRYLAMQWEELANRPPETDDKAPMLVRLLRQSLLLTQAEVARLHSDRWPTWTSRYVLPLHRAEELASDASRGEIVADLPRYAQDRLDEQRPPDARVAAVVRQFRDLRDAVRQLADLDQALLDSGPLAPAVAAVLDSSSHRIDPWATAPVTRRLRRLAARGVPRRLGAYGWVDDLRPSSDPTPPTAAGLLHAPGHAQALTAAVLRDHFVHDTVHGGDPRWKITARSDLVRLAARLGADVRLGIHLSEAIGREIERRAGDPAAVLDLRRNFPARPEQAGRRVCDGLRVLDADPADLPFELGPLEDLRQVLDTYGDLLVADAVHDVVSGRIAQAQESMEAATGLGAPPELRLLRTQRQGATVRTTVLIALPPGAAPDPASPVQIADPGLAALLRAELPAAQAWTWTGNGATITLADLGLDVPDVVLVAEARLTALAEQRLGGRATGGTASGRRAELDRLCSLLDAQHGLPELTDPAGGPPTDPPDRGEVELRVRLGALRAAAAAVIAEPTTAATRRWGLPDDPAAATAALTARLDAIGTPESDATADAAELSDRIRTQLAPASGLPLLCTGTLRADATAADLDRDWLEVVAAVRPALARLEAHQLRRPWPAAATDPARLWAVPAPGERHVVVYGPAAHAPGPAAIGLLDDWIETVPSTRHTTHAAFGFDSPRARAPQAILLAVPADEQVPLTADALPGIVLATRRLARARMAQPDQLGAWSLAVPTSMVLTAGPAGARLAGP